MRVLVDGVVFENTYQLGIWRVFFEILSRLASKIDITLLLRNAPQMPVPPGCRLIRISDPVAASRRNVVRRVNNWLAKKRSRRELAGHDLYHSAYFTPSPVPDLPVVATVYDMIPESLPYICDAAHYVEQVRRKQSSTAAADRIIGISHATVEELGRIYPDRAERAVAIHLGSEHLRSADETIESPAACADAPYALFVGQRFGYKNFGVLSVALLDPNWPRHLRLLAAGSPFTDVERISLGPLIERGQVVGLGRVSDKQLAELYRNAACFVFPSLMEGFGLPLLEAQSLGCPVVCSDTPCFREVAGNGGAFFSPHSHSDLIRAVVEASTAESRRRLVANGLENVTRFSWERTAEQTLDVYCSLLTSEKRSGRR
jgi:glycosyltransferase involved in cell wall biosynthesis